MRVFQRLFIDKILKYRSPMNKKGLKNLEIPPSFFKIPYDEQYEPRDFVRVITNSNSDGNSNGNSDGKKE